VNAPTEVKRDLDGRTWSHVKVYSFRRHLQPVAWKWLKRGHPTPPLPVQHDIMDGSDAQNAGGEHADGMAVRASFSKFPF
jgi:hypothetical protein